MEFKNSYLKEKLPDIFKTDLCDDIYIAICMI